MKFAIQGQAYTIMSICSILQKYQNNIILDINPSIDIYNIASIKEPNDQ